MSQAARTRKTLLTASAMLGTICVLGAAGRAANAADHPNLQPGRWETSMTMEMTGMPSRPATTSTHCIKPDEVKDNRSIAERMQTNSRGKCSVTDVRFENDKLSYSFACDSGAGGSTELVFGGTTYEGTTRISVPGRGGNGAMTMTQHFKSKRIGDC